MTAPPASSATALQGAQDAVAIELAAGVRAAFASTDVSNLSASLPGLARLLAALTAKYGAGTATLAARHYAQTRLAAGVTSRFTVVPADPAPLAQVGATVRWATQPLWSTTPDLAAAERNLIAGVEKLVLDAGRATVVDNVHRDRKAHGWARVTEPQPCAFCALLATRGAVYRSDKTADFKSHDHCRCVAEPVFGPYEPSAQVREWQQLYRDSTTGGNAGRTRKQWRAAFNDTYGQ